MPVRPFLSARLATYAQQRYLLQNLPLSLFRTHVGCAQDPPARTLVALGITFGNYRKVCTGRNSIRPTSAHKTMLVVVGPRRSGLHVPLP